MSGTRVPISWSCNKCAKTSAEPSKVYLWPGETPEAAALRWARETRGMCSDGCLFTAKAEAK